MTNRNLQTKRLALALGFLALTIVVRAQSPVPAPEPEPAVTPSGKTAPAGKPGAAAAAGKGFWGALSQAAQGNAGQPAGEGLDRSASDEIQKKVSELVRLAHMNVEKGRLGEAIKSVNDLIALKPYEAEFHLALGLCYRREGKHAEALKKYQDVLDLGGPKALVSILKAESFAAENKPERVFELLKEAAIGGRNIITDVRLLPLLSGYQQDTEFIKLALQLEKFTVAMSRTHDPFTNPFPRKGPEVKGGEGAGEAPTALTPEDQEKMLLEARKLLDKISFLIKIEDENKAMKAYSSLREILQKKDLLTVPRIVSEFRQIVSRLEGVEVEIQGIRLKYYYNLAQAKLKQMKELFADGEYAKVEGIHIEVQKLTQEMEATNVNYKPVADQILGAAQKWVGRAQVRQDFESRKPNVQGIVISDNNKMAILNDRIVKQGELIDDFRVLKVESNRVTFRYKGEEIPLVFRRY